MVILMEINLIIIIGTPLENNIKEFINTQKVFNTSIEEKLSKIDDLSRSVDRIAHDVENLKMENFCA